MVKSAKTIFVSLFCYRIKMECLGYPKFMVTAFIIRHQKMDFPLKYKFILLIREGLRWLKRLIRLDITATSTGVEDVADIVNSANGKISDNTLSTRAAKQQLLIRLQRNDQDAWDEVFREWSQKLFSYLRYSLPTSEDADDLLSETFMAAVKSIHHFDGKSALSTWLYTLAHNKMVDFWRGHQQTDELPINLSISEEEIGLDFQEALGRLPSPAQQALLLRYREDLSVSEVAHIMGKSYKATESLLSRARSAFKEALTESGIYHEEVKR